MASQNDSFFTNICTNYGHNAMKTYKRYATNNTKLCSMLTRKEFLIQCRRNGIFPPHIVNSLKCTYQLLEERSPFTRKLERVVNRCKKALLSIEIQHTFHSIKQLKKRMTLDSQQMSNLTASEVFTHFTDTQTKAFDNRTNERKRTIAKKLQHIIAKSSPNSDSIPGCNEKALLNATDIAIPQEVQTLISLGPKFALPSRKIGETPLFHLIADVESILCTTNDKAVQDRNRSKIATNIQNHLSRSTETKYKDPAESFCQRAASTTKQFLAQHPNVCVLQSDKGKRMVVMFREEYDRKMLELFNDPTYEIVSKDPTPTIERKNNNMVDRLLKLKIIDKATATRLHSNTAVCPRIYGQPKAHKHNLPLRPVVPNITAPTYKFSKYIANIMKASLHSSYNIKDSFEFATYVNSVTLPKDYVLVSFDVVALFTHIPKELVLSNVISQWNELRENTDINLDLFLEIVAFCLDSCYFQFRDKYYVQLSGTAMGSPISPIFADLVMEFLLMSVTANLPFTIPLLHKYVDDLILALPRSEVQRTLAAFNNYNENLQFTMEEEVNNTLPFLDMLLIRNADQSISTQWYTKSIASGRLLNWMSYHPTSMKVNVADNFIKRVTLLTTNQSQSQQRSIIFEHLRRNDFPSSLINRLCNMHCNIHSQHSAPRDGKTAQHQCSITQPPALQNTATALTTSNIQPTSSRETAVSLASNRTPPASSRSSEEVYRSLPYVPALSETITRNLKVDFPLVKIGHKSIRTVGGLFTPVKDPVCSEQQANVIYRIPCSDCSMTYIGMTRNKLKTRLSGHQSNINKYMTLTHNCNTDTSEDVASLKQKTALLDHMIEKKHKFDLTQTKIIDRTHRSSALSILEMLHISNTDHTVNYRTDTCGLNSVYAGILHAAKQCKSKTKDRRNSHTPTQ